MDTLLLIGLGILAVLGMVAIVIKTIMIGIVIEYGKNKCFRSFDELETAFKITK